MLRSPIFAAAAASLLFAAAPICRAGTFAWVNTTGNWNAGTFWAGGTAPSGLNATDQLIFGGNVSSVWTASNDVGAVPFLLNQITDSATDPSLSGNSNTILGSTLRFAGATPNINVSGEGGLNVNLDLQIPNGLTVGGTGTGRVTLNGAVIGMKNITKTGPGTLRFGTIPAGPGQTAPSMNAWVGTLVLSGGAVAFNNNAQSGATALRANPVVLSSGTSITVKRNETDEAAGYDSSLRMGTLSGTGGTITARVVDESAGQNKSVSTYDVVITALSDGTYAGALTMEPPVSHDSQNPGNDSGKLIVRGPGIQTLTGVISVSKDLSVGYGATLKLAGAASLGDQSSGAIQLAGGTMVLDNSAGNIPTTGRLRDGSSGSTSVETIGGGTLNLIGSLTGTSELTGRLQLGTSSSGANKPRSGALDINLTHTAGSAAATELRFQSYLRKEDLGPQFSTVDFSAVDNVGATKTLGLAGNNPRIFLTNGSFTVPLSNGLLSVTAGVASVGWATVNGDSFASYDSVNGVVAATTTPWSQALPITANALITASTSTPTASYTVNTIKMAPVSTAQSLNISGPGNLASAAYLLAGGIDFLIQSTGGGGLAGTSTRFFQVPQATLTVSANLAPLPNASDNRPVVKSGNGTLVLTNTGNANLITPLVLNGGAVRVNQNTGALPSGEIQIRGGILELTGGGTFTRPLGLAVSPNTASINWSGLTYDAGTATFTGVDEDRGSGGFAAVGADVSINITSSLPRLSWETGGFLRSGYALVFGSTNATNRVTWTNDLGLTDANATFLNYNAREIKVVDNPNASGDSARITGNISGTLQNDLLKTGNGTLELANATGNSYLGATIVQGGTLLVNTNNESSFVHDVKTGATLGGNGRVAAVKIEAGGTLSPGDLAGHASILHTTDLYFVDATSHFLAEIGGTNAGGDTITGYDRLDVTGTVELNNADLKLQFLGTYTPSGNDVLFLILNDGTDAVNGQFSQGSQITVSGFTYAISYGADFTSQSLTGGNDVALQLVPEPSTFALLGLGTLLSLRRPRRRA